MQQGPLLSYMLHEDIYKFVTIYLKYTREITSNTAIEIDDQFQFRLESSFNIQLK